MQSADRAARERKQKIFVAVGGLLLLALLAFELPHYLGGSSGSSSTPPTTTTADASAASGTTPQAAASTPATTTSAPVSLAGAAGASRPPAPGPGQLSSFSKFPGKDPFVQQVTFADTPTAGSGAGSGSGSKTSGKAKTPKATSKGFTVGSTPTALATVISVNGVRQALVPGTAFPSANPVFVLVSEQPKTKSVVVGVAGGAYASGAKTTRLVVGRPLVLVNTTTGARYKIALVAVGNGQAAPKTTPKTSDSATGSATTPSTP